MNNFVLYYEDLKKVLNSFKDCVLNICYDENFTLFFEITNDPNYDKLDSFHIGLNLVQFHSFVNLLNGFEYANKNKLNYLKLSQWLEYHEDHTAGKNDTIHIQISRDYWYTANLYIYNLETKETAISEVNMNIFFE